MEFIINCFVRVREKTFDPSKHFQLIAPPCSKDKAYYIQTLSSQYHVIRVLDGAINTISTRTCKKYT